MGLGRTDEHGACRRGRTAPLCGVRDGDEISRVIIIRSYGLSGRGSRARTVALAVLALAIGGVLLAFGVFLLATLAIVGTVATIGLVAWRRLTGRGRALPPSEGQWRPDPTLEVPAQGEVRRIAEREGE